MRVPFPQTSWDSMHQHGLQGRHAAVSNAQVTRYCISPETYRSHCNMAMAATNNLMQGLITVGTCVLLQGKGNGWRRYDTCGRRAACAGGG